MEKKALYLVIVVGFLLLPSIGIGSGGAPPSGPPGKGEDAKLYHLGKQVVTGKATLGDIAADKLENQRSVLESLQEKLPNKAKNKVKLAPLAGKLTEKQLDGVKKYLIIRYRIK
ncbi:MAG: hypothetical protein AAGA18_02900 [Verrucomicrobiota bacterium]